MNARTDVIRAVALIQALAEIDRRDQPLNADARNTLESLTVSFPVALPAWSSSFQDERYHWDALRGIVVVLMTLVLGFLIAATLPGCAALPMPLQPSNQQGFDSSMAEGAFIVTDTIDTLQTMHIRRVRGPATGVGCNYEADPIARRIYGSPMPPPGRVLAVNLLLLTFHTMVASWLDDKVAAEYAKDEAYQDNDLGLWYVGRIAFHSVSLIASGSSVANNVLQGCKL